MCHILVLFYSKSRRQPKLKPIHSVIHLTRKEMRHSNNQQKRSASGVGIFVKLRTSKKINNFRKASQPFFKFTSRVVSRRSLSLATTSIAFAQVDPRLASRGILKAYDRPRPHLQGNFRALYHQVSISLPQPHFPRNSGHVPIPLVSVPIQQITRMASEKFIVAEGNRSIFGYQFGDSCSVSALDLLQAV
jgi:hypothetical protein